MTNCGLMTKIESSGRNRLDRAQHSMNSGGDSRRTLPRSRIYNQYVVETHFTRPRPP